MIDFVGTDCSCDYLSIKYDFEDITKILLILTLAFQSICYAVPYTIEGTVTKVMDGDTIEITDRYLTTHKIRFAHIDAPESNQEFGVASKNSLTALTNAKSVSAACDVRDMYARNVCTVKSGRINLNREQVKRGLAWVYVDYAPKNSTLYPVQRTARSAKIGLWSNPLAISPWEFRKARR